MDQGGKPRTTTTGELIFGDTFQQGVFSRDFGTKHCGFA
ncbi:MAG: hypothetical protein CM1200mP29_07610 [Verrucomicrobiota bacterium]|nr:MAG: hypothetical protein CM1200mP29_07610 [Verrucomicrobiota bacterium]